jgi:hypothetical protein
MAGNGEALPTLQPEAAYILMISPLNVSKEMTRFRKALGGARGHSSFASTWIGSNKANHLTEENDRIDSIRRKVSAHLVASRRIAYPKVGANPFSQQKKRYSNTVQFYILDIL